MTKRQTLKVCNACGDKKETTRERVIVQLAHATPFPLVQNQDICAECRVLLATIGIPRVRNTKLILAT